MGYFTHPRCENPFAEVTRGQDYVSNLQAVHGHMAWIYCTIICIYILNTGVMKTAWRGGIKAIVVGGFEGGGGVCTELQSGNNFSGMELASVVRILQEK